MVDCLELEILLLGNHEQRPTEKEEEIWGHLSLSAEAVSSQDKEYSHTAEPAGPYTEFLRSRRLLSL